VIVRGSSADDELVQQCDGEAAALDEASTAAKLEVLLAALPELEASAALISEFEHLEKFINTDAYRGVPPSAHNMHFIFPAVCAKERALWMYCIG
jgi:hypothetical protein